MSIYLVIDIDSINGCLTYLNNFRSKKEMCDSWSSLLIEISNSTEVRTVLWISFHQSNFNAIIQINCTDLIRLLIEFFCVIFFLKDALIKLVVCLKTEVNRYSDCIAPFEDCCPNGPMQSPIPISTGSFYW